MNNPTHTHVCPACGKEYSHGTLPCGNNWFLACSEKCAQHLDALERYLRTRGIG